MTTEKMQNPKDWDLPHLDKKIEELLGPFQKVFQKQVFTLETLGPMYGYYGSFLPAYKNPPKPKAPALQPPKFSVSATNAPPAMIPKPVARSDQIQKPIKIKIVFGSEKRAQQQQQQKKEEETSSDIHSFRQLDSTTSGKRPAYFPADRTSRRPSNYYRETDFSRSRSRETDFSDDRNCYYKRKRPQGGDYDGYSETYNARNKARRVGRGYYDYDEEFESSYDRQENAWR